jgi:hypothetical protein
MTQKRQAHHPRLAVHLQSNQAQSFDRPASLLLALLHLLSTPTDHFSFISSSTLEAMMKHKYLPEQTARPAPSPTRLSKNH